MNDRNNINVFISSKNRDINSKPYDFTCYFPDNLISCLPTQGIKMNIISFDMINSMYNINTNNNSFQLIETDLNGDNAILYDIIIPEGNYNVKDIANYINSNNTLMNITYNSITNKYIYNKLNNLTKTYIHINNSGSFLGFDNGDYIEIETNTISNNKLNIVYSNKVIIRASNLSFEASSLENINNRLNTFEISNIILWLSKNDIAPFQVISYNNEDGGNSYCYNLYNRTINNIHFLITNEYDEVIEDCPEWTMSIQFSIYERKDEEIVKILTIMNSYLREIYVFMNLFFSFILRWQ